MAKAAPQIFHHALERMGASAENVLFTGDDPQWDVAGPKRIGMQAALLDRAGRSTHTGITKIRSLAEVQGLVTG